MHPQDCQPNVRQRHVSQIETRRPVHNHRCTLLLMMLIGGSNVLAVPCPSLPDRCDQALFQLPRSFLFATRFGVPLFHQSAFFSVFVFVQLAGASTCNVSTLSIFVHVTRPRRMFDSMKLCPARASRLYETQAAPNTVTMFHLWHCSETAGITRQRTCLFTRSCKQLASYRQNM